LDKVVERDVILESDSAIRAETKKRYELLRGRTKKTIEGIES